MKACTCGHKETYTKEEVDKLLTKEWARGYDVGFTNGQLKDNREAYKQGYDKGFADGEETGYQRGYSDRDDEIECGA